MQFVLFKIKPKLIYYLLLKFYTLSADEDFPPSSRLRLFFNLALGPLSTTAVSFLQYV